MIDNFDLLVQRCTLRRRRRMIRLSLMIVATILLAIASVSGYQMWLAAQKTAEASAPQSTDPAKPIQRPAAVAPEEAIALVPETAPLPAVAVPQGQPVTPKENNVQKAAEPLFPAKAPAEASAAVPPPTGRLFDVSSASQISSSNPLDTYRNRPSYETALAVARDFYARSNFADAAVWAKKANQLNREEEEAWLLYAKSYYAQGRKNEAIGVLELYLNYKDSRAAMELLRTWKQSGE